MTGKASAVRRMAGFVSAAALLACGGGGGGGDGPTAPLPRARLLVTVHVLGTSTPIPGVAATIQGRLATSDANGMFTLSDLETGPTTMTLVRAGFENGQIGLTLVAGDNTFSIAMQPSAAGAVCAALAGAWRATWTMPPCGPAATGSDTVTLTIVGCTASIPVPGLGTFTGEVDNRASGRFTLQFAANAPGSGPACPVQSAAAYENRTDTRIDFTFGSGPAPCCQHGALQLRR